MSRSQIDIFIDGSQTLEEFIKVTIASFDALRKDKEGGYISVETMRDTMANCMRWGAEYQKRKGGINGINEGTETRPDPAGSKESLE